MPPKKRTAKSAKLDEEDEPQTTTTTAAAASGAGGAGAPRDLASLNKLKVDELKAELAALGLETDGRKPELVARLFDASNPKTAAAAPAAAKGKGKAKAEEPAAAAAAAAAEPAKRGAGRAKKARVEADDEEEAAAAAPEVKAEPMKVEEKKPLKNSEVLAQAAAAKKASGAAPAKAKVDEHALRQVAGVSVYNDYDCMLNQTNSANNNNKYYVIQLLTNGTSYWTWNRWGRVGEPGQNALKGFGTGLAAAEKDFCAKYKDKTSNTWDNRANFVPRAGKYTQIEMDYEEDDADAVKQAALNKLNAAAGKAAAARAAPKVRPCTLPAPVQSLLKLIFSNDMFKNAMQEFNIDMAKMPLGKISLSQLAKGYQVLEQLQDEINNGASGSKLTQLSDQFYTHIPHSFGRTRPPTISSAATVRAKMDMLDVLGDIATAQALLKAQDAEAEKVAETVEEVDDPLTVNYKALNASLVPVDRNSAQFKAIEAYTKNTSSHPPQILDIFEVVREGEEKRHDVHNAIKERKLLWHGTNVAVVVAILKSGLRIMPHSGGRVGAGIYFADMNEKSAGYVRSAADRTGIMFLNEVALGKEHGIFQDDSSLRKAPAGFDSIVARGTIMPTPANDTVFKIEGRDVVVPQGPRMNTGHQSSFHHNEYLVYNESQCRIRYLLKMKF
ncbi:poly synthetase 3 [Capsaspora owczarzaki ATCC 30864]|uniref:Poly [ADP-ribose] polymerase n=1 Tax=Capsaspora owczarzaki (strain ATCC 30864) TaxID=595528 RepID=A0A0D2VV60_CAPO3|nr:poly synthetase 3 [Capsaspora owczarzaki ATCC 30864]KJE95327.1 poly synthetase 3 [Capsaspora owczarzaki ATCC 30864]|eukprot:XP_004346459.1 poly synthetase 3 [Capsaspora owczarzaki ATCC 30864]